MPKRYTDEEIQNFINVRDCHMDDEAAEIIRQLLSERNEARADSRATIAALHRELTEREMDISRLTTKILKLKQGITAALDDSETIEKFMENQHAE